MSLELLSKPEPRRLTVAGRDLALTPVRMGKLAAFSKAVMPVTALVLAGRILEAVTEHWEEARTAVSIGAGVEPEWLDDLDSTDFLRIAQAVIEVNGAFFVQRLTPILLVAQAHMLDAVTRIGAQSSPTLDETATA